MNSDGWKGITSYSSYDIALYRKHMAPLGKAVTADTLDRDCTSLSEYLATIPQGEGKQWADALLSSSKYLVLDLCLYLQDTLAVDVEGVEVYVEQGKGMSIGVRFLSHSHYKIELRLFNPEWPTPSSYVLSLRTPGLLAMSRGGYKLANGLRYTIHRVLGMEYCSTCTFSNDNNSYCGVGALMYTSDCTQRVVKYPPHTDT